MMLNNCKVVFYPDIALINQYDNIYNREGIGICIRKDKERNNTDNIERIVEEYATQQNIDIEKFDTVINCDISIINRKQEVKNLWDLMAKKKLIVTDRLHGMIFSIITKTPCIAFDNLSKKVSGVYSWVSNQNNVICIKPEDLSKDLLDKFYKCNELFYKRDCIDKQFYLMEQEIRNYYEGVIYGKNK